MRLYGYYAFHSLINQIRKMLRTWVLIFILCCGLLGGLIGYGAAMLAESAEDTISEEQIEEEMEDMLESADAEEGGEDVLPGEAEVDLLPIPGLAIFELAAGAVILALFVWAAFMADQNGSKIFLPADVTLLFPSPMKPQAVLMFRLCMQMGMMIFFTIYMFIEVPSLVMTLGLTPGGAIAIIVAWGFLLIFDRLIQLSLYVVGSVNGRVRELTRPVLLGLLALIAAAFLLFVRTNDLSIPEAAAAFFNARQTRWIPIWGWLKGLCMYAIEGNLLMTLVMGALLAGSAAFLIWFIWQIKADFYEDAMAKSEETARLMREMQERGTLTARGMRKKDRSDTLIRDGMHRGSGANVFFFKTLYNRFRFARFRFVTKTMLLYLAAGAGGAWFLRMLTGESGTSTFTVTALIMGGIVFFRSLGNPLDEDVRMAYFRMIPEPAITKLFWSVAGGSANTALDLLPGLVAAAVVLAAPPTSVIGWLLMLVSLDLYSTTTGTFIDISVPVEAGATVKQMTRVMFVYFGLLPAAVIIAIGYYRDSLFFYLVLAAVVHLLLGLVFLAFAANALEPADRMAHPIPVLTAEEKAGAQKDYSWCMFCVFVLLAVGTALQFLGLRGVGKFWPELLETEWGIWVFGFAPLHLIAFPACLLLMRRTPQRAIAGGGMKKREILLTLPPALFLMYGGNFVGTYLDLALRRLTGIGTGSVNAVAGLAMQDSMFWKILVMVIMAPLMEELVFRKALIGRLHVYGQRTAVLLSAAAFGLFHGNVPQIVYAFLLGLVLGYVYVRTGKIQLTILLHMIINFLGSIVAPALLELVDMDAVTAMEASDLTSLSRLAEIGLLPLLLWFVFIFLMSAAGAILLILYWKRIDFAPERYELTGKDAWKAACLNPGTLVFLAAVTALTVFNFVSVV